VGYLKLSHAACIRLHVYVDRQWYRHRDVPIITMTAQTRVMIVKWRIRQGSSSLCSVSVDFSSAFAITSDRRVAACNVLHVDYRRLRIWAIALRSASSWAGTFLNPQQQQQSSFAMKTRGQSNLTKSASRGPIPRLGVTPGVESCTIEFLG